PCTAAYFTGKMNPILFNRLLCSAVVLARCPHRSLQCGQGIMVRAERKSKNEIASFRGSKPQNPAISNRAKLRK
ncbi:MAG: hypothetical protein WA743_05490, partial [Pseudolabrys sp.]